MVWADFTSRGKLRIAFLLGEQNRHIYIHNLEKKTFVEQDGKYRRY